jgi:hypothetical protein
MNISNPDAIVLNRYNQFIACWDEDASLRPTFPELKRFFEVTLQNFQRK